MGPREELVERCAGLEVARFRQVVLRLWEHPPSVFLNDPGLAPLAPFARDADRQTVERAMRRLSRVRPPKRRAELQVALSLLADSTFPGVDWLARIPEEIRMASTLYERIRKEGEQRGEKQLLVRLLNQKFGPLPDEARERLETASLAQLRRWAGRVLTAETLADVFRAGRTRSQSKPGRRSGR